MYACQSGHYQANGLWCLANADAQACYEFA